MIVQQKRYWYLNIYFKTLFYFKFNWSVYPLISSTKSGPWPELDHTTVTKLYLEWENRDYLHRYVKTVHSLSRIDGGPILFLKWKRGSDWWIRATHLAITPKGYWRRQSKVWFCSQNLWLPWGSVSAQLRHVRWQYKHKMFPYLLQ